MELTIRPIEAEDVPRMQDAFRAMGWSKPEGYFAQYHAAQERGEMVVFVAWGDGDYAGHARVLWVSMHRPWAAQGIPEINDLAVLPAFRRRGVGGRLLDRAENAAFERSAIVALSVGLHPGYNAAQRMYVARGYVPDGEGITYRDLPVVEGQAVQVDDSLLLHLTKHRPTPFEGPGRAPATPSVRDP